MVMSDDLGDGVEVLRTIGHAMATHIDRGVSIAFEDAGNNAADVWARPRGFLHPLDTHLEDMRYHQRMVL